MDEPTDASLSALVMWLHAFRRAAAPPGSEPERLSAEVPGSVRSAGLGRPIERFGRRSWSIGPPGGAHISALACPGNPRGSSDVPRNTGAGERPKRIVRLARVEPSALSRVGCSPKTPGASRAGISSCVKCGDSGRSEASASRNPAGGPPQLSGLFEDWRQTYPTWQAGESRVGAIPGSTTSPPRQKALVATKRS